MAIISYVTAQEYTELGFDSINENLEFKLKQASRKIDLLTFFRINGIGFENLTEFQKGIIKDCVCEIANFYDQNEELTESVLDAYSINGVSMKFNYSGNVEFIQGVFIPKHVYRTLMSTGLCRRVI
jgi:hypothetical protein